MGLDDRPPPARWHATINVGDSIGIGGELIRTSTEVVEARLAAGHRDAQMHRMRAMAHMTGVARDAAAAARAAAAAHALMPLEPATVRQLVELQLASEGGASSARRTLDAFEAGLAVDATETRSQIAEAIRKLIPVCAMLQPPPDAAAIAAGSVIAAGPPAEAKLAAASAIGGPVGLFMAADVAANESGSAKQEGEEAATPPAEAPAADVN